jgi:hypothetical protein
MRHGLRIARRSHRSSPGAGDGGHCGGSARGGWARGGWAGVPAVTAAPGRLPILGAPGMVVATWVTSQPAVRVVMSEWQ